MTPRALGTDEAARYLSLSRETFRKHVAPDIRPIHIGRRIVWLREDLDLWLDRAAGKEVVAEPMAKRQNPLDALL
ncbi:helix-turn-helix transcriptional regulator [Nguyenibacter vanlangensis]|uniref:helix-turn-helix transcriptional regulator n=1 Tax=Nguyenibacter vanlangensis TaxID=1216886 RepID=UPI0029391134|nr:helix-turn-helix domain-containing protein [Nguyenibacter vanlangensis]